MKKTIISFTTIPSRINKIEKTIGSIINQPIDEIVLWLPKNFKRVQGQINNIPKFLINNKVNIQYVEDIGSITKIWYALKDTKYENCNIITIDDDVIYPSNFVQTFLNKKDLDEVLCYRGRILNSPFNNYRNSQVIHCNDIKYEKPVHIVTGTWGAIYKSSFFDKHFFERSTSNRHMVDDIYISANMWRNNIPMKVINNDFKPIDDKITSKIESLWAINARSNFNNETLNFFKQDLLKYKYL